MKILKNFNFKIMIYIVVFVLMIIAGIVAYDIGNEPFDKNKK